MADARRRQLAEVPAAHGVDARRRVADRSDRGATRARRSRPDRRRRGRSERPTTELPTTAPAPSGRQRDARARSASRSRPRAEVRHEARAERRPAVEEDTQVWGELHADPETEGALLIDDFAAQPAADPVIGPQFAAARERLGLTVDQLADRTRIRPHVIEAIEIDDFAPAAATSTPAATCAPWPGCSGVDVAPLLATYDEHYADAPIDPRRVFEAELAGPGPIRGTRGGPNWSVLVAAVMALILCWSVARLVTDGPTTLADLAVLQRLGRTQPQPAGRDRSRSC